jgi:D-alanine-D-alanine ligase
MSVRAHQALGCRDFSRVDWRVNDETLEPYLLEVNVIPGLTSHSLLPKAAAKAGLSMPMLGQRIVDLALGRARSK